MSPEHQVLAQRRPRRRLEVRRRGRGEAGAAGTRRLRLHPQAGHRPTGRVVPKRRGAGARGHRPHRGRRDSRGPHRGPRRVDPRRHAVDARDDRRRPRVRRVSSAGASRARRRAPCWRSCRRASSASTTRSDPNGGELLLVYPNVIAVERQLRVLPSRFPAVGVPARGHPPGAVPRQPVAGRPHVAVARGAHRGRRRGRRRRWSGGSRSSSAASVTAMRRNRIRLGWWDCCGRCSPSRSGARWTSCWCWARCWRGTRTT